MTQPVEVVQRKIDKGQDHDEAENETQNVKQMAEDTAGSIQVGEWRDSQIANLWPRRNFGWNVGSRSVINRERDDAEVTKRTVF